MCKAVGSEKECEKFFVFTASHPMGVPCTWQGDDQICVGGTCAGSQAQRTHSPPPPLPPPPRLLPDLVMPSPPPPPPQPPPAAPGFVAAHSAHTTPISHTVATVVTHSHIISGLPAPASVSDKKADSEKGEESYSYDESDEGETKENAITARPLQQPSSHLTSHGSGSSQPSVSHLASHLSTHGSSAQQASAQSVSTTSHLSSHLSSHATSQASQQQPQNQATQQSAEDQQKLDEMQKKLAALQQPATGASISALEAVVGVLLLGALAAGGVAHARSKRQHRHQKLKAVADDDDYDDEQDLSEDDLDMEKAPKVQYAGGENEEDGYGEEEGEEDMRDDEVEDRNDREVVGGRQQAIQDDVEDELRKKQEEADQRWKASYTGME
jgi:hypothetical protein